MQRLDHETIVLDAKGATGITNTGIDVSDFRHITVSIATDGGADANLTVKCQGSIAETLPNFAAAQTVTNMWDYVAMYDYEDASKTDGDTGFVVAGADDYKLYTVNVDGLKWVNLNVTARSAGEVTVKIRPFDNQ